MGIDTIPPPIVSPPVTKPVKTRVDTKLAMMSNPLGEDQYQQEWDLIETKLIEWGRDPSQLDEEGTTTPSVDTIQLAIETASRLSRDCDPAPTRVVPDVHGAIVFELQGRNTFESLHVQPDGRIEHRFFRDHRLQRQEHWVLETDDN